MKTLKEDVLQWIKDTVGDATVVIGMSGGKDSTIAAAACVKALGKDKVIGVRLPVSSENADDVDLAYKVCEYLGIKHFWVNAQDCIDVINKSLFDSEWIQLSPTKQYLTNIAPRIRMTYLYAVANLFGNTRVVNTSNRSETYIGWCTKWGDNVGDFAPLKGLLCSEVKRLGYELKLPEEFIEKAPADGLTGKTDENNFGFTYEDLDNFIRTGFARTDEIKEKIISMHKSAEHKANLIPFFVPQREFGSQELVYEDLTTSHIMTQKEREDIFRPED